MSKIFKLRLYYCNKCNQYWYEDNWIEERIDYLEDEDELIVQEPLIHKLSEHECGYPMEITFNNFDDYYKFIKEKHEASKKIEKTS